MQQIIALGGGDGKQMLAKDLAGNWSRLAFLLLAVALSSGAGAWTMWEDLFSFRWEGVSDCSFFWHRRLALPSYASLSHITPSCFKLVMSNGELSMFCNFEKATSGHEKP